MSAAVACLRCGAPVFAEDRFCGACGTPRTPSPVPGGTPSATGETNAYGARLLAMLRNATAGEYEIRGELGRGGMASVYLAYDLRLNRKVAIKVMLPELAFHDGMEARFKREARTAAKLDHPNIVVIYSVRDDAELLYFVMKFIEGASLEQIVRRYTPLPIPVAQHVLVQLARALQYAHEEGVVHRDVKPANVLIDRRGNALVTDFGIAKATEAPALTRTGSIIGTPAYMSPEQCMGHEQTHASDQYSLGVVAYELIAGHPPFTGPSVELQWAHVKTEAPQLLSVRPDCPPGIAAAVMRMLAKNPADRWPSLDHVVPSFAAGLVPGDESPRTQLADFVRVVAPVGTDSMAVTPASPIPRGRSATPALPWTSIQVSPVQAELEVGDTVQLAVAFLPPPAPNVTTPAAVWTSSAPTIVGVSESGIATGLAAGSAIISAQAGGHAAKATLTVHLAAVASITLTPPARPLEVGVTQRLACVIRDAHGRELTGRDVDWASSNPSVASINAAGEVTTHTLGKTTIGATSESISATVTIEVVPDRVAEVTLTPETLTLHERASGRLSVRANNERGKAMAGRPIVLRSADSSIAAVGPDGVVVAKAVGRTTISGTLEGQTGTATVIVRPAAVATIEVMPQAPSVTVGSAVAFAATVRDGTHHGLTGRVIKWKSSNPAILRIDEAGRATALGAGTADVTADCEGITASVRVTVAPAPIVSFEVTAPGKSLRAGKRVRLRAKARDATGREFEPDDIAWRSTKASVATVAADGTVSGVGAGEATILAAIPGREAMASLVVSAAPPPRRIPIAVPLGAGALVVVVGAVLLFARNRGGDTVRPPARDTLATKNVGVGPVTPPAAPRPDSSVARQPPAAPDSAPPPANTTPANPVAVAALRVTSRNPLVLENGEARRVAVRATTSEGKAVTSPNVTWTSADPTIASVSATGTVTARAEGRTSITAATGDATARIDVVVGRATPAAVAISPRAGSVKAGEQTSLTARVRDRAGLALPYQVVWRSSNPGVATVDNAGTVRGVRQGEVTILALAGGATDSIRLNVTASGTNVATNPPAPAPTQRPPARPAVDSSYAPASGGSAADVDAALTAAAQTIGAGFGRGQIGPVSATSQLSRLVRENQPQVTGAPQIQRRSITGGRAEGDVSLPLRWKTFTGSVKNNAVVLRITLEQRSGAWQTVSVRNLNNP